LTIRNLPGKPQRGLIGVLEVSSEQARAASHFNGWYQMAMKMRAFRYATSTPYHVPTARYPLTIPLPAIEMAGRSALATLDTSSARPLVASILRRTLSDAYGIGLTELAN